ncbi:hypothetical protein Droror1_Dr00026916 [Drosera rotundifolia]
MLGCQGDWIGGKRRGIYESEPAFSLASEESERRVWACEVKIAEKGLGTRGGDTGHWRVKPASTGGSGHRALGGRPLGTGGSGHRALEDENGQTFFIEDAAGVSTSADVEDPIRTPTDVVDALADVLEVDKAYDTAKAGAADLTRTAEEL